jgi:hypothetical protein
MPLAQVPGQTPTPDFGTRHPVGRGKDSPVRGPPEWAPNAERLASKSSPNERNLEGVIMRSLLVSLILAGIVLGTIVTADARQPGPPPPGSPPTSPPPPPYPVPK